MRPPSSWRRRAPFGAIGASSTAVTASSDPHRRWPPRPANGAGRRSQQGHIDVASFGHLAELERVQAGPFVVERDLHWTPCKAREANLPE